MDTVTLIYCFHIVAIRDANGSDQGQNHVVFGFKIDFYSSDPDLARNSQMESELILSFEISFGSCQPNLSYVTAVSLCN